MDDHQPNAPAFKATPMFSEKGNIMLVVDNYKFCKNRKLKTGTIKWRCVDHKCGAKFYTKANYTEFKNKYTSFNHYPHKTDNNLSRQRMSNACKIKATAAPFGYKLALATNIIREELEGEGILAQQLNLHDVKCIYRNTRNAHIKSTQKRAAQMRLFIVFAEYMGIDGRRRRLMYSFPNARETLLYIEEPMRAV